MSAAVEERTATPLLPAATPQEWLDVHLLAHLSRHDEPGAGAGSHRWVGTDELLADGAAFLRDAHARILATDGGTPQMAAKWLVGWTAGTVAEAVGFVLGAGDAGVLADTVPLRWRLHPDGWVDRTSLDGATVVVLAHHPWAGRPGVEVAGDELELVTRTVDALVSALRPVVDAVRGLARVGAASLWAEVADSLGLCLTYQPHLPVREDVVDRLRVAVTAPGAPWRVSPTVRTASAPWGPAYLGQKGGCCLAYQRPEPPPVVLDDLEGDVRDFYERFPPETGRARVCSTCSLRDPGACAERQLWWLERRR